jgi:biotin carboxyl carrier protein
MKKVSFEIENKTVEGYVSFDNGTLWMHVDGATFTHELPRKQGRRGGKTKATALSPGETAAPMPGKIIKILVEPGAKVAAGQVLLVMEAMKMEYTLKAQADGVVEKIECEPGQQVALGQLLVKMEVE